MSFGFSLLQFVFKSDARLRSLDSGVAAVWDVFGNERRWSSPGGVVISVPTVPGDDDGDWDFVDRPSSFVFWA